MMNAFHLEHRLKKDVRISRDRNFSSLNSHGFPSFTFKGATMARIPVAAWGYWRGAKLEPSCGVSMLSTIAIHLCQTYSHQLHSDMVTMSYIIWQKISCTVYIWDANPRWSKFNVYAMWNIFQPAICSFPLQFCGNRWHVWHHDKGSSGLRPKSGWLIRNDPTK